MPVITWYLLSSLVGTAQQGLSETSPGAEATSSPNYGWTVGTNAAGQSAHADAQSMVARNTFSSDATTAKPGSTVTTTAGAGNGWITTNPYTGTFPAGNWTFQYRMLAGTGSTSKGHIKFRAYRVGNTTGTSPTAIQIGGSLTDTALTAQGTAPSTTVAQTVSTTVSMPAITLSNEYLLFTIAFDMDGAGGSTSDSQVFRVGNNCTLITTTSLTTTSTRTIPATVQLFRTSTRTIPATVQLSSSVVAMNRMLMGVGF